MDLQSYKVGDKVIYTDRGEKLNAIVLSTETKTLRGMMKELRIQFVDSEGNPVSGPQGMPTMIINDPTTLEKASGGRRRRKQRRIAKKRSSKKRASKKRGSKKRGSRRSRR